ncbi:glycosyltransferase family 15 protein [Polychaeton citri CBS 116435]|uniref:Glycosyltransferase family 15 protein n=1 Tax=Polychaeton citri CBS 116435 TaxID=1314669 RepID=A0A9P4QFQ0_9PEZI|nr:glycosyltransferase family 15 protein [Polychaeton citri CBS 116435]
MLARNSDLKGAIHAITSLEEQWNKWYNYPIVFLNNEKWDKKFIDALSAISSGKAVFETIPESMWSWPKDSAGSDLMDRTRAQAAWEKMKANGIPYATKESYHHMCRFYSGFFQDHPAVAPYKYYWRIEPDVKFTCRIPYDPFRAMRRKNKIYGYTVALWEIGSACPSFFRAMADFKEAHRIRSTSLWTSIMEPSWAPLPIRKFFMSMSSLFHSRDRHGDSWNHCHFWSNFEIADFDFFRSDRYRELFRELDASGGFFMERWGDAPMHSLALALLADPRQVHYFEDIGYQHPPFQHCPSSNVGCDCDCSGKDLEELRGAQRQTDKRHSAETGTIWILDCVTWGWMRSVGNASKRSDSR